ncbi:MAG: glycogen synthase, partial [Pseudomonadota bacterium]
MKILQVSAELFPLIKTGGLADVAGALPAALKGQGCDLRPLLPGYPEVWRGFRLEREVGRFQLPWGEPARVVQGELAGALTGYVLDLPSRFNRSGNPYEDSLKQPYADNHLRFAALCWAGAHLARGLDAEWHPHIVHAHDWHAGLLPACLRQWALAPGQADVRSVFTIHNLAYQGLFGRGEFDALGLNGDFFQPEGLEFHGAMSFMKAGIFYSDLVTTVSPRYAQEIQTSEQGCGLDGLLRQRSGSLQGILNG